MLLLPSEEPAVAPLLTAGLLLAALPHLHRLDLPHPTATAVVDALGVSRSRAYELRTAVEEALPALLRPAGRPPAPEPPEVDVTPILRACRDFVYDHPGAVERTGSRRRYSDVFRMFILRLADTHRDVSLDALADAVGVPIATLRDWLAGGTVATTTPSTLAAVVPPDPTSGQVQTLLELWSRWKGTFVGFCRHANEDWRLPFRRTLIATILHRHGVRFAKRRSGRSPDEDALRGQFTTYFPNAQWVGDGAHMAVDVDGQPFAVNLELLVDPCSGAFTGASVRDTEDAVAVIEAVQDGIATTGTAPLAVLLDNKPSNHAEEVHDALGDIPILRATPYRPQNKAHIEGGFGLFRQIAPTLAIATGDPRALARQLVELVIVTWARTLNHRPRKDRGGRTRVELHLDHEPTADEISAARAGLKDLLQRQEKARQTLAARQDPQVRNALAEAFARFGFADPEGEILNAIARYPLDAVVEGIAITAGKHRAGTWPAEADARYLLGIVRNIAEEREGWEIALALWDERKRAHDHALGAAERVRDAIDHEVDEVEGRVIAYADRALGTARRLDRFFWLGAIGDTVLNEDDDARHAMYRLAARRIASAHEVPHRERSAAIRFLAARLVAVVNPRPGGNSGHPRQSIGADGGSGCDPRGGRRLTRASGSGGVLRCWRPRSAVL